MRTKTMLSVAVTVVAALATGPARSAGWFTPAGSALPGLNQPIAVELADVTGDGHLDLLTVTRATHSLNVRTGTGNGTFQGNTGHGLSGHSLPTALAMTDFNADGLADGVMTYESPPRIMHFRGVPSGISAAGSFPIPPMVPTAVGAGDVTGDGRADIVVAGGTQIAVYAGNGNLTFGAPSSPLCPPTARPRSHSPI